MISAVDWRKSVHVHGATWSNFFNNVGGSAQTIVSKLLLRYVSEMFVGKDNSCLCTFQITVFIM